MSEIKLNLLDSKTTIIATVHGSVGDALVAALSTEPETIEELEAALKRFERCETIPASTLSRYERCEIDDEPWDAGILVINLAARVVACESTYSLPGREGSVDYHDGTQCTGFPLSYRLDPEWIFLRSIEQYRALCDELLERRAAIQPLDARLVLYCEPLLDFIIQNVRQADFRYASACRDLPDTQLQSEAASSEDNLLAETVVDIHRRWLTTPREDLNGHSPREILFAKRDLINFDLESRMLQWSYFLEQPPPLSRESYAYRYAGFGTHEWVIYYDLVRYLIWSAVDRVTPTDEPTLLTELEALKLSWLTEPNPNMDCSIPFQIIDNERRRLPEAMTGRSMVIDENCPCCKAMGDESEAGRGIYFCHFDGSHMEDEFAFSWCTTMDDWEAEQRRNLEWEISHEESRRVTNDLHLR